LLKTIQKLSLGLSSFIICVTSTLVFAKEVSTTEDWERREILVDYNTIENVEHVFEEGAWSNDGFKGSLKFIITSEKSGASKLFVQWIADEDGEPAYTVSIREFNSSPEFKLDIPKCINDDCTLTLISAEHVYEETPQKFTLNLVGLGRYSVGLFNQ